MCWWPPSLSEMWSDWTEVLVVAVALDQSGVQSIIPPPDHSDCLNWVSLQQKVNRDSTWQWKLLAEQLYVCLIDSSSVFHLCGWEWPCGSICALCLRLPSFGHSVIWLWAHLHQGLKEMLENISGIITIKTKETADWYLIVIPILYASLLLCSTILNSVKRLNDAIVLQFMKVFP